MAKLTINVDNCYDCPFAKTSRYYTDDSFEMAWNYYCGQVIVGGDEYGEKFKKIASYVERRSDIKGIPDWCPLLDEKERAVRKHERVQEILDIHGGANI